MHDAVWVLTKALVELNGQNPQALSSFASVSCDPPTPWKYGVDLLGYMKSVRPLCR